MKRLGEILIERGVLALSELHTGLEACRRSGGRLGTQLLRFGFVDEPSLLRALAEQYGVRAVASAAPKRRSRCCRWSRDARPQAAAVPSSGCRCASGGDDQPRDSVASKRSPSSPARQPFVATEAAVLEAIARLEARRRRSRAAARLNPWVTGRRSGRRPGAAAQLLAPRRPQVEAAPRNRRSPPSRARVGARAGRGEADHPIDEATLRARLASVTHRDEIASRRCATPRASSAGRACSSCTAGP
jgi:hypothetical protein